METKICKECEKELLLEHFRLKKRNNYIYYSNRCINCENKIMRENSKKYYKKNKEKILQYKKEYSILHPYKYKYNANKSKKDYEYKKIRREKDYLYKFKEQCRMVIYNSFKRNGHTKKEHTNEIIGMTLNELFNYLLQTYKNNYGYEWNRIEKVHIDHIIPLSTAKTEEEVIKLCHYTNLQLLKAEDNIQKRDKLDWKLEV